MSTTPRSPRFLPSPSSPSASDTKLRSRSTTSFPIPHSPVSPALMSVATKSYVSAYGKNQHTDEMAQRPPRSPTENYMQSNQRMNPQQEGSLKRANPDDDGQHREKRQKLDSQADRMEVDSAIAPTNHDRHNTHKTSGGSEPNASSEIVEDEFSQPFLLGKSSIPRSHPDPKQHLLATYGLLPLLKTVARNDPQTGEKINKLRKSYEGQIKTFSLSGRNKPVKCDREEDEPGPLRLLATISEQEWDEGPGRSKIEITTDFRSKLEKAMQIQPGTVRNNAMWEDVLGHEKPKGSAAPTPQSQSQPQSQQPARIANGATRPSLQANAGDKRSTRGNFRSYGDESFVGYGEGFSEGDDDGDEEDYARRKRKKNPLR